MIWKLEIWKLEISKEWDKIKRKEKKVMGTSSTDDQSSHNFAFFLAYMAVYNGSLLIFFSRRRHRSHFSFMSQRRLERTCGKHRFTIFILGVHHRSLPMAVTAALTPDDLYSRLAELGLAPANRKCFYFSYRGRRIPWEEALGAYGVSNLSHLQLNLVILGGGNQDQPTASSSRPHRERNTSRIDKILEAERMDEDGNPEPIAQPVNSDPDDSDFETDKNGGASTSSSDSDIEEVPPEDPIPSTPLVPVQPSSIPKKPKVPKMRNAIYYFFEKVDENADGSVEEGARYYKCYLGNRKSHFLAHYRLFKVLNSRDTPPTDVELALARGSMPMTPEKTTEYLEQLDSISKNIKGAVREAGYCLRPVDAVEFRELLQYTHHPARKALKIPHAKSVKVRIDRMSEEMVASLSEMFKVCYISDRRLPTPPTVAYIHAGTIGISFSNSRPTTSPRTYVGEPPLLLVDFLRGSMGNANRSRPLRSSRSVLLGAVAAGLGALVPRSLRVVRLLQSLLLRATLCPEESEG
ncbi:hypothetical protein B0H11DRAFT_1917038 [Mycena galericulata]|nr:hypothetical protein B0H11DRAFT_1917038 [Mycena galericulata]